MSSIDKKSHFRTVTTEIFHLLEGRYSQSCDYHSTGINMVLLVTPQFLYLKNLHKFFWKEIFLPSLYVFLAGIPIRSIS